MTTEVPRQKSVRSILQAQYPDRVPVVITPGRGVSLRAQKFIVPQSYCLRKFAAEVHKHVENGAREALFMLWGPKAIMVPMSHTLYEVYNQHRSPDEMLHCTLVRENTFGAGGCQHICPL